MRWIVVTGAGRSGTQFFANLIAHSDNAKAFHERLGSRLFHCISYYDPDHPFVLLEINRFIDRMEEAHPGDTPVVLVDPNAVFAVPTIRRRCPNITMFHLVRDGQAVVASNWTRKMYTKYEKAIPLLPKAAEDLTWFLAASRFEKLAWHWKEVTGAMLRTAAPTLHLEKIVDDYDYLREAFLNSTGIELRQDLWSKLRGRRANKTEFKFANLLKGRPSIFTWSAERRRQFAKICGPNMAQLGYWPDAASAGDPSTPTRVSSPRPHRAGSILH